MPRKARKPEEVHKMKEKILETALQAMVEDGFAHVSMRKLAAKLGMTAANIYNYYSSKDELYLAIQTRGYELLGKIFGDIYNSDLEPVEKLEKIIHAYLDYGVNNPNYYDIMFNWNTPKYADYVGTPLEAVALHEKQTALQVECFTSQAVIDVIQDNDQLKELDAQYHTIKLWVT
ncbi:MAG: TetR/AcrR family transcriptional regulator, partial [Bacillota bacterium]|nr:TetR/AcrR family transcriptional regulator [Bacillota bacterium]